MRPGFPWGQGWRKGGRLSLEKRISPEQNTPFFFKKTTTFHDAGKTPGFGLFISKEIPGCHDVLIGKNGEP